MKIMILSPKINFLTNVYVHIENLSCYHRWSDKSYPHQFANNAISPLEKRYLAWYRAFRKRHFFDREYEDAFSSGSLEQALKRLKHLKTLDKKYLEKIFLYFMQDFRKEWNENIKGIKPFKNSISKWWEAKSHAFITGVKFISDKLPRRVPVFVCWNPVEFKATQFGKGSILIEMNKSVLSARVFQVIPHELAHMMDISYGPDSLAVFKKLWGSNKAMLVHEAVISILFPGPKQVIQDTWSKDVDKLVSKIRPSLRMSIRSGEPYEDFLLRIPDFLDS